MERGHITTGMGMFTKELGKTIRKKALVLLINQMATFTMVIGLKISLMDMDSTSTSTGRSIEAIINMVKDMGREYLPSLMARSTRGPLNMTMRRDMGK